MTRFSALTAISTPKPSINVTIEVPPALTKGKGTPTTGRIPATMPILTKTYTKNVSVIDEASKRPKPV